MPPGIVTPVTAIVTRGSTQGDRYENSNPIGDHCALIATAIITIYDKYGRPVQLRALLDSGSHINAITTDAQQKLHLPRTLTTTNIHGVGGIQSAVHGAVNVLFTSRFKSGQRFYMQALIMSKLTGQLPSTSLNIKQWYHTHGIELADPYYHLPGDIDVLIGIATYAEIMEEGLRRGKLGEPIAQCSKIGWIIYGQTKSPAKFSIHV